MEQKPGLQRQLKLWHVIALGLSLMVPTTVFDTFGIASTSTEGHVPASYLFSLVAMLFTVFSYSYMVKAFPGAGSAYTYAQQTFHPSVGFIVGWAALCDYLFLPMLYALAVEIYMSAFFPGVPSWLWIVLTILFFTVANLFQLRVTLSFNAIFVVLQLLISVIFVALLIRTLVNGEDASLTLQPFYSANLTWASILAGSIVLSYTFIGFDALTTLSEEAYEPRKTIPRAMIIQTLLLGAMYITITYFMQLLFPDVSIFEDPDGASPEIAQQIGGLLFASIFVGITVTGNMVGGIAAQISTSRLLYAMGRDSVFPKKIFGYVHPRTGVPVINVLLTGAFSMTALLFDYETVISFFSFGAYTAFTFVNLSAIWYHLFKKKMRTAQALFLYLAIPVTAICFLGVLWSSMDTKALILGLIWNCIGFLYLLYFTRMFTRRPPKFEFSDEQVSG